MNIMIQLHLAEKNQDCDFTGDRCWWKHTKENEANRVNSIECYYCEKMNQN